MPRNDDHDGRGRPVDIRLRGFADRAAVDEAIGWIDARARVLPSREIDLAGAGGRVLAAAVVASHAVPSADRVAEDGYALRAAETNGAGPYNPLTFGLERPDGPLPLGAAALVASGAPLPWGADAVLAFHAAEANGATLDVFAEVVEGAGIERQGRQAAAGTVLIASGRRLRAQDLGVLASLGVSRIAVVPQPRVSLIVAGPKSCGAEARRDANGPMLRELIRRDGGIVSHFTPDAATQTAMTAAMGAGSADVVLIVGRTGAGVDDIAPLALAEAGELSIHGVALRPGGSAGLGRVRGMPVVLLPGDPLACLGAYEMFAGRLIRRLGGRDPTLPHPMREMEVARKIVSAIGLVDLCPVRVAGEQVEPVGSAESGTLRSAVEADGFIVVPASIEGYPPGARVAVHLYPIDEACG